MTTHVIILAQGEQSRLPGLKFPKQLLRLPACANAPILERTLRQLEIMISTPSYVTVVTHHEVTAFVCDNKVAPTLPVGFTTLGSPGNSSLKGLYRFLKSYALPHYADHTVVLLGDVVYSWQCLKQTFRMAHMGHSPTFTGTSNLSKSAGELWGMAWPRREHEEGMMWAIERAMDNHPPASVDDTYQPGQLRRVLWVVDELGRTPTARLARPWFARVDDYTMDVDTPADIEKLTAASLEALADDKEHNLSW